VAARLLVVSNRTFDRDPLTQEDINDDDDDDDDNDDDDDDDDDDDELETYRPFLRYSPKMRDN